VAQHRALKEYAESVGVVYSSSVWDTVSAKEIAGLEPEFIKIPSACNTNTEMLSWLAGEYKGEIQISTGMTTKAELRDIMELFRSKGRTKDIVIYHCTSGYPVPYYDLCLLEITNLLAGYGGEVREIGYSGHHLGVAMDVAAYALGATVIERHFTLDRAWKGTDHSASLEPDEFKQLVFDLKAAHEALRYRSKEVLDIEEVQRKKLKWQ
jgi:N-acetylneuraminate synthase